jgi:toxin ParE1/3/4
VSNVRVEFAPDALREIDDAFEWYFERSTQAAKAFLREVESAISLIASAPEIWPRFEAGTRRYPLRRFPYSIVYRATAAQLEVVAVVHHRRRPLYWVGR